MSRPMGATAKMQLNYFFLMPESSQIRQQIHSIEFVILSDDNLCTEMETERVEVAGVFSTGS